MKKVDMENLDIKDSIMETINVKHDDKIKLLCRLVKPSLYDIVKLSSFFSFNELIIITTLYEPSIGCLNMLFGYATNFLLEI